MSDLQFHVAQNFNITFSNGGGQIGTLDFNGPEMKFTGNAEESAKVFFNYIAQQFSQRLKDERQSVQNGDAIALLRQAKRNHYHCDDCWYTCPKHEDGCCNDDKPKDVCDCGADEWNAKVDAVLKRHDEVGGGS